MRYRPHHHHSDLNIFAAIVAILEGGCIYTNQGQRTAFKLIRICKDAEQSQLRAFDRAIAQEGGK